MTRPSLADFGTHDESAYPELWTSLLGTWIPSLGPTGDRLYDFSRFANWGTLTNMDAATDWVIDNGYYGLDFDGSNDRIAVPKTPYIPLTGNFSVHCWVKTIGSVTGVIAGSWQPSSLAGFQVASIGSTSSVSFLVSGPAPPVQTLLIETTGSVAPTNRLLHIYCEKRSNQASGLKVYINAIEASATIQLNNPPSDTPQSTLTIGNRPSLDFPYRGIVYDVSIFNRPLSQHEILTLYSIGPGGLATRRRRKFPVLGPSFLPAWARNSNVLLGAGATC